MALQLASRIAGDLESVGLETVSLPSRMTDLPRLNFAPEHSVRLHILHLSATPRLVVLCLALFAPFGATPAQDSGDILH